MLYLILIIIQKEEKWSNGNKAKVDVSEKK